MKRIVPIFAIILLCLSACSTPKTIVRPDWVKNGVSATYPTGRCLVGIGSNAKSEVASDQARAEIAKQFSVKVEGTLKSLRSFTGSNKGQGQSWRLETSVDDSVSSSTNETLQGVTIAETYLDPEKKIQFALATLMRGPAALRLEEQVGDLNARILTQVNASKEAPDALRTIRPLLKATELMKEREIKNSHLMVVSITGQGTDAPITFADLDAQLTKALAALRLRVSVTGDGSESVQAALVRSITAGGLPVVSGTEAVDLLVKGVVTAVETEKGNKTGFVFAKFNAQVQLINAADGQVFGQVEIAYRDGAKTLADAKRKTLNRLSEKIVAVFNPKLHAFLTR